MSGVDPPRFSLPFSAGLSISAIKKGTPTHQPSAFGAASRPATRTPFA
jgi:hypothetical protein